MDALYAGESDEASATTTLIANLNETKVDLSREQFTSHLQLRQRQPLCYVLNRRGG